MTTALLASLVLHAPAYRQEPVAQEATATPAAFIGAMLVRYRNALTISGQWTFRQVATAATGKAEVSVNTRFAMQRPGKVRIDQKSSRRDDKTYLFVSDGSQLTSDVPDLEAPKGLRQMAPVTTETDGSVLAGRVIADASKTIPDPFSPFFAVAGSWNVALENWRSEWASLADGGRGEVNGVACRIIKGKWRRVKTQNATGTFGIWISDAGDLLRYSYEEELNPVDEDRKPLGKVTILTEWTGALTLDPVLPPDTFKLVP